MADNQTSEPERRPPIGVKWLSTKVTRGFSKRLAKYLAVAIIGAIISQFVGRLFVKTEKYLATDPYLAVVVSEKAIDFPIPTEFKAGFETEEGAQHYLVSRDNKRVRITKIEDLGSIEESQRIAHRLVDDKNCIMVIGNSNSALTDATLDIFLRSEDPPTYMLPIATANDLITKAKTAGHGAVLRMVPDNDKQSAVIERLVRKLAPSGRVAIYGDQENETYSLNLSRDVASKIRANGGKVVIEESLGPTHSFYNTIGQWRPENNPPEVIIYVGVAHHGLLLIDQFSELKLATPMIFTDGCMVGSLFTNAAKLPGKAFVLSPVGIPPGSQSKPTYHPIGQDAYSLAKAIIADCTVCTRKEVREYVATQKGQIKIANGYAGPYEFDSDGNNRVMTYKVYEISGGSLKPYTNF